ncbi:helix-turn-helix domain-containing protein [Paenibacillus mucilaginosus]|uniref:AraC family transcriptional regulator n=3 Tax=Paenibacillus mucilaginosus TaxID=61624 RepID=H6NHZ0_9BACL|nr:AraC family transcriptional regulator [Paenibacillus mucilaginosus]AEI43084.1 transcriptional regulator, AraC family [Paenibacillus mucilaginosus KNP414]AFC30761.1 AraC family transcriptional regulator [Paenibacillus mucilaginosus 3016]AFH63084.1 AraC family transcriptional regulator [Paenibacillus mucilaginosus K02]MCG7212341.1 AraC family transcriptional regulator [Paenibacillus mucilaginosus]WDM24701.1 helix-turn-helix transcriptional regulator [Paenibacillus mucilaginosus]
MNTIQFSVIKPSPPLSRDIECIRVTTQKNSEAGEVKVCPSGQPGMLYQRCEDGSAAVESIETPSSVIKDIPLLFLHGQGSEPSVMRFKAAPFTTIQVVFKSHALYSLFGMDASSLHGKSLSAGQFGAEALEAKLLSAETDAHRVALLEAFLTQRLEQPHKRDELMEQVLDYMRRNLADLSVSRVLSEFPISERQFQKRFARVVGMAPQLYIRLIRVNEAIRLINSGEFERLSDVAQELNYYDQSHFIREIRTFSFVSPKILTLRETELHVDETGSSYM